MKAVLLIFSCLVIVFNAQYCQAQDSTKAKEKWKKEANISLNLTQSKFDNYVQGGENTFAWQGGISFQFSQKKDLYQISHSGKMNYGRNKIGEQATRKTVDEIKLESVYTQRFTPHLNPFLSATGETQFAPGYDYTNGKEERSDFLDPGFFRESIGLNYTPNEQIKGRLGFSAKQTITSDHFKPFADDPSTQKDEKIRLEYGMESVIDLNIALTETSKIISKLELFSNLKRIDETDIRWDTKVTAEITKYFDFTMNFQLLYDKTISPKRQIMEMIGVGLGYRLF